MQNHKKKNSDEYYLNFSKKHNTSAPLVKWKPVARLDLLEKESLIKRILKFFGFKFK